MNIFSYINQKRVALYLRLYTLLMSRRFRLLQSIIDPRVDFKNPEFISIGRGVNIRPFSWIYAIVNDRQNKGVFNPSIEIGDDCVIGRFCHITASNKVVLGAGVCIGEGVLITDSSHIYEDINTPIIWQNLISRGPVIIGGGSWIGDGAKISGKVHIGRNCVIGANAFVNKDIPDYCVAVGIPARIIKRFDKDKKEWLAVKDRHV